MVVSRQHSDCGFAPGMMARQAPRISANFSAMNAQLCQILFALAAGFGFSVVVGGVVVGGFHSWRKHKLDVPPVSHKRANPQLTGFIEHVVFTALVIAQPENAVVAMGGWLALKMAATWNKNFPTVATDDAVRLKEVLDWQSHSFLALLSGFLCMAFAGAGGAIARYLMGLPIIQGWPTP